MATTATHSGTSVEMGPRDWSLLVLLGAIWGGSFFFARVAVAEIEPLVLVLLRVGIAALALQLYLAWRGLSFGLAFPHARALLALALLNNVIPFSLIFAGQTAMGAGLAAVLNATTPFWTLIVANLMTGDEKLTGTKVAGIGVGLAGVAVMIGPGVLADLGGPVWPKLAILGAALSYAFALIVAKRMKRLPSAVLATGQLTASTAIMVPVALASSSATAWSHISAPTWAAVLALALLSTAFAYLLYFRIVASAGATNASLVTLLVPVSAILLGAVFLGERLELFELGGMALIAIGLVAIDGRLFRERSQKNL